MTDAGDSLCSPDMVLSFLLRPEDFSAVTPNAVDSTGVTVCKLLPGRAVSILRAGLALTGSLLDFMEV